MVDTTWTNGGGDGLASNPANWSNGIDVGYNVIFDGTSVDNCTFDYDGELGTLSINAGYTGTITQSSDIHITGFTQAAGTFTGVVTKCVYCSGSAIKTGGSFTGAKTRLVLSGTGTLRIAVDYASRLADLHITSTGFYSTQFSIFIGGGSFLFKLDGTLITTTNIVVYCYGSFVFYGSGKLMTSGGGISQFQQVVTGASQTRKIMFETDIVLSFLCQGTDGTSHLVILQNNIKCRGIVADPPGTRTCVIDINGYNLTANALNIGVRTTLQCGEGTITTGVLDSSAGTITEETATWIFERGSTIKVAAAQKLYNVIAKGSSALKLLSDLGISGLFAHPAEIDRNGFTLTMDQPDKEYTGLRRPIIIPVKKLDIGPVGLLDGWLRDLGGLLR